MIGRLVCPMQAFSPWRDLWLIGERPFSGGSESAAPGEGFVALRCGHGDVLLPPIRSGGGQAASSNSSWRSRWAGVMGGALGGGPTALRKA